ncbi:hypothetical protein B0H13DRAFT_2544616 [Mycena leptocephala]|nr:hypothetical protein B0H13DRAFT_2544616 [Mycena leptocephala]
MSTILAAAINRNFASAAAHTYRPFYLPNEDTLPASDSLDAAKREYFMAAINALNVSGDEVSNRVMGPTGSGKTSNTTHFINTAKAFSLARTNTVQVASPFRLDGRWVTLIDTPGFDDNEKRHGNINADSFILGNDSGKKLASVIYLHRISDVRMGGISTRNFKMFREPCGESTLRNVVIVGREAAREAELASDDKFFKPVLGKGARLLRHDNDIASAQAIIHYLIRNQPRALRIQRELVDQGKAISQTAAGEELNRELAEQIEHHKQEMAILQQEMRGLSSACMRATKELELETRKLQTEMTWVQDDSKKLASDYTELKKRMAEVAETARREAECAEEKHRRQIKELETIQELGDRLRESTTASAAEKEEMKRQISELKQRLNRPKEGLFVNIGRALDSIFF